MAITKNAPDYYIHDTALTFTPNYQDRDIVFVSIVSNAAIAVLKPGIPELGYAADAGYQRWSLTGYTTKLGTTGAYNIYARLSRSEKKAMIIFSVNDYNVDGSVAGGEASAEYWYIKIGDITASEGGVDRQLNYDSGILGTNRGMAESNTVLEKMFKWNSTDGTFTMQAYLINLLLKAGAVIKWGERQLKGIVGMPTDYAHSQQLAESEDTLVTPKFVKAYSDLSYVSKKKDDTIEGNITFKQDANIDGAAKVGSLEVGADSTVGGSQTIGGNQTVQGGITISNNDKNDGVALKIGDFIEQGDIIQGAQVTKDGIASFAKVKTPSMQVYELTLNRKTAVQGEFVFSDGEVVENVEFKGADTYLLTVRALYEGYITTFKKDDILYSNINIIGSSAKTGKCWMYVTAVDGNKITAVHFPYEECPAGENINPVPYMTITRHGNISDKTRQDLFIISSETSSLTMLRGVSDPIVSSEGLYGVVIGKLPATLLSYIHEKGHKYVNSEDPYVYARGVIVQDLIMLDYQGQPIPTEAYRGEWQAKTKYYNKGNVYDSVTHQGSLWQCLAAETTEEPSDNSKDWLKKVSKGEDGDMPTIFTITSSLTSIHQDSSGKLNTNILDIWVNAVGAPSNFEIKDQATLDAYGLSVWFNIDEQEDVRKKLIIGGADAIEVEEGGAIIVAEEDDDDGGAYITLESESIDISSVREKINIYLVRDADEDGFGIDENRMYIPVMRDGQRGRMLYPAGVYDSTKEYMIENNSAPFVKEGSTFYVLVWEGGFVKGVQPSADTQGKYWRQYTSMNYLFAEFLMANWARLGGDNGAVFYDKWLFSQMLQNGEKYTNDIIDENGNFNKGKYPKYAVNFLNGTSYMTNLIEPMNTSEADVIRINPSKGFNWFIPCNIDLDLYNREKFAMSIPCSKPMVILPTIDELNKADYSDWDINGAHITITFGTGGSEYAGLIGLTGYGPKKDEPTDETYVANEFILVCVDDAILNIHADSDNSNLYTCKPAGHVLGYGGHNFFICGGKRARYMMMAAGTTLKLRPVVINKNNSNNRTIHWFVESDGVYSHPINIYSTAYVIPSNADATEYGDYRVRLHNKKSEGGYAIGWYKNIQTISVYASKETLADKSIASNLDDRQEYADDEAGCVFVCGEPELLPHNIVVSAQKMFNTVEATKQRYHYRALFKDTDGVGYDMIEFS